MGALELRLSTQTYAALEAREALAYTSSAPWMVKLNFANVEMPGVDGLH